MTAPISTPPPGSTSSTLGERIHFCSFSPGFSGNTTASTGRGVTSTPSHAAPTPAAATSSGKGKELVSSPPDGVEETNTTHEEVPAEETKPPSRVDTAPASPAGARDPNAFAGVAEAQDMEESTDNAPPTVVADQLEAFRKEIEAMHKQINDWDPSCRESDVKGYWLERNQRILNWLLCERSSIICLQEFWVGNEELVSIYDKRLGDAGYINFKLARTNNRGDDGIFGFSVLSERRLLQAKKRIEAKAFQGKQRRAEIESC
ncbi:hypothetical protein ACS0TY_011278 [Phlomoides rotata]